MAPPAPPLGNSPDSARCPICADARRAQIDDALLAGGAMRVIGRRFQVSVIQLEEHWPHVDEERRQVYDEAVQKRIDKEWADEVGDRRAQREHSRRGGWV
jgi:hypothetical protein